MSFNKMAVFPVGYFRATCEWLLRERRDVVARVDTLTAEMERIGFVHVQYERVAQGDAKTATYRRTGFTVTKGSSLSRLVQAYIAQGGNPLNACGFLHPETTDWVVTEFGETVAVQKYPGGGAPGPKSADYNDPLPESPLPGEMRPDMSGYEGYRGGMVDHPGYMPGRLGSRLDRGAWDYATVNRVMHDVRGWANKEIKTRLQDMEWRIVKLSDCWEQLKMERDDVLLGAFAGQLSNFPELDPDTVDPKRLVQVVMADMYDLLFDRSGSKSSFKANPELGFLYFALEDDLGDGLGLMSV